VSLAEDDSVISEELLKSKAHNVLSAIEQLSPKYRVIANMYAVEDYSMVEIAKELGISERTGYQEYFRMKRLCPSMTMLR
jgi:RNA polymerase sigma-70 factor (ECF subfamily)